MDFILCILWSFFNFQYTILHTVGVHLNIFDSRMFFIRVHITHQDITVHSSRLENNK